MSEYVLEARPALGGFVREIAGTTIREATDLSIVSISVPLDGDERLDEAIGQAYGARFPDPGKSSVSEDGNVRFLWMAPDQTFAVFEHADADGDSVVAAKLGDAGYYTLQSDNWVALRLRGKHARAALERICQIDLHPSRFVTGDTARTVMEHMGAIVVAEDEQAYLLLSAWSSAQSFLHAVETSLENVA